MNKFIVYGILASLVLFVAKYKGEKLFALATALSIWFVLWLIFPISFGSEIGWDIQKLLGKETPSEELYLQQLIETSKQQEDESNRFRALL